jgi:uncharacterized protein (DUF1778 family)
MIRGQKMTSQSKPERSSTTIRFNDEYTRRIVYAAAELQGQSLSSFMLSAIRDRAENVIKERRKTMQEVEKIVLSPRASIDFMQTMLKPPKPNKKLIAAVKKFGTLDIKREE